VAMTYTGAALQFPDQRPTDDEILDTEDGHQRLAGFLVRRYADRVGAASRNDQVVVRLHFDH